MRRISKTREFFLVFGAKESQKSLHYNSYM
uniref:Uncharacterized protein n=1 Tax=Anguilla anguilla TaxID=7936 RepID=A0A0E9PLR4_ANGAN